MDLSALHQYLITKNEVNDLLILLERLAGELFKENFNLDELLSAQTSYELNQHFKDLLRLNHISPENDRKILQSFIENLQNKISNLPVVHIILAFSPKKSQMQMIHDWFFQNFKQLVLLDISVDEDLIAGGVISFKGKANDYSLKNQIDQMQASD